MDIDLLLAQSLELLGIGMGAVFIILTLLICIIWIVSKLVPEEMPAAQGSASTGPAVVGVQHIAVIQAAIHKFRKFR